MTDLVPSILHRVPLVDQNAVQIVANLTKFGSYIYVIYTGVCFIWLPLLFSLVRLVV